jgi:hypothetical protein
LLLAESDDYHDPKLIDGLSFGSEVGPPVLGKKQAAGFVAFTARLERFE